jgi:predicted Zn-dependent protease
MGNKAKILSLSIIVLSACAKSGETLQHTGKIGKNKTRTFRSPYKSIESSLLIGYEEERIIGGALAVETVKRYGGLFRNRRTVRYVNLIGRALAQVSDRPDIKYYFAVLNSMEPGAFAAPAGYIFITRGILTLAENEAELAGVLAHEIAHVTKKHILKTLSVSRPLAGIAEIDATDLGKNLWLFDSIMREANDTLFNKGLDQSMEYEADELGMEYAYRLGYDPSGLSSFQEKLEKRLGKEPSVFFKTHPLIAARISRSRKLIAEKYADTQNYRLLAARYREIIVF